jgi:F0F1-type ATP synthase membrane subunit c/vacuolar-type H+-ATPase subunit K
MPVTPLLPGVPVRFALPVAKSRLLPQPDPAQDLGTVTVASSTGLTALPTAPSQVQASTGLTASLTASLTVRQQATASTPVVSTFGVTVTALVVASPVPLSLALPAVSTMQAQARVAMLVQASSPTTSTASAAATVAIRVQATPPAASTVSVVASVAARVAATVTQASDARTVLRASQLTNALVDLAVGLTALVASPASTGAQITVSTGLSADVRNPRTQITVVVASRPAGWVTVASNASTVHMAIVALPAVTCSVQTPTVRLSHVAAGSVGMSVTPVG